jgi:6-phospho-beta-glucosidase
MNFAYNITVKGRPVTGEEFSYIAGSAGGSGDSESKELMQKIGALSSPYLQYYFHRAKTLRYLQELPQTRGEAVLELEKELFEDFANPQVNTKPESLSKRGGGGYSEIAALVMDALYNNRGTWTVANVPNNGILSFLPCDAVIETPCIVDASGAAPVVQAPPPPAVWGLIAAVKNYEILAVEAAVTGNKDAALLALLAHPLIGDYDIAKQTLDKLIEANRGYLTNFTEDKKV